MPTPIDGDATLTDNIYKVMLAYVHKHNGNSADLMSLTSMIATHVVTNLTRDKMAGVDNFADMLRRSVAAYMHIKPVEEKVQ